MKNNPKTGFKYWSEIFPYALMTAFILSFARMGKNLNKLLFTLNTVYMIAIIM